MRRVLLAVAIALLPGLAYADGWVAQMEEDEGGKTMVASVAGDPDGKLTPLLRLMCAGSRGVMLSYAMTTDTGGPGSSVNLLFENESKQVKMQLAYEAMDGAFVAYFHKTDPMIDLLDNGPDLYVSEATGDGPATSFSLEGATKAISAVLKGCK